MKILDLFAGIGVASLAAEKVWPGIGHEFVEINPYSQTILKKHFPNSPIYGDIRTYHPAGTVDIVWGSPPCQAASTAGKRQGTDDSRWLWPDTFRVIAEAKPRWYILENVYGLLSLKGGLEFEALCVEMDKLGYEIRTFVIPALAVGAPHRRDRVWIVANAVNGQHRGRREPSGKTNEISGIGGEALHSGVSGGTDTASTNSSIEHEKRSEPGRDSAWESQAQIGNGNSNAPNTEQQRSIQCKPQKQSRSGEGIFEGSNSDALNSDNGRSEKQELKTTGNQQRDRDFKDPFGERIGGRLESNGQILESESTEAQNEGSGWEENWIEVATRLCRVDDGASRGIYRLTNGKTLTPAGLRTERLKALGNSLVYPLVVKIFEAIKYAESNKTSPEP